MRTSVVSSSNFMRILLKPAGISRGERMCRVPVLGRRVQLLLVLVGQVRLDVEDHFLDRAGERERLAVLVAAVDHPAVVTADAHDGIAGEADGAGVVYASLAHRTVVDEQGHL